MFEKLLLAATITFSLNLFLGLSAQSVNQQSITARSANPPTYLAKLPSNRSLLAHLFQ